MADFEQVTARRATINDLEQTVLPRTSVNALKPCVIIHRV
jgi:hypothetical protein